MSSDTETSSDEGDKCKPLSDFARQLHSQLQQDKEPALPGSKYTAFWLALGALCLRSIGVLQCRFAGVCLKILA